MKRFTLTHLLLFVTWCGIGCVVVSQYMATMPYTGSTHDIKGSSFYDYGAGERFTSTIDEEKVRESPSWNPRNSNPPLSAREALSIAEKLRKERLKDVNGWKWGLDSLTLYPLDGANNKWCWRVSFVAYPEHGAMAGHAPEFNPFVLMNGKVIPPEAEPYDSQFGIISEDDSAASDEANE